MYTKAFKDDGKTILVHTVGKQENELSPVCFISDYYWKLFVNKNIDEIWGWYEEGNYEGSGEIVCREKDKYKLIDLSHCSCYGPFECFEEDSIYADDYLNSSYSTPEEITKYLTNYIIPREESGLLLKALNFS